MKNSLRFFLSKSHMRMRMTCGADTIKGYRVLKEYKAKTLLGYLREPRQLYERTKATRNSSSSCWLQDNSKSSSGEVEVKFQLTKDTLDTMLRLMTYLNDQLSGMVYIEMHFFGAILDNIGS
ncbi:protein FAR1-RELATED SEQUENCE 3-like [Humulus lupulus]|uniref:protein FAR1-RELATED SEQUENCE 3-like n=1 Tax=Humulus lupulus TaxID=3486 RepID=UPI002B400B41|nr:protein FAR1-RELATED SEQUENCE 3-like [Humulus lupulus]